MDGIKNVITSQNVSYKVDRLIGEGGQGKTFLLEGGEKIAKLFNKRRDITSMKSMINYLIQLGLNKRYYGVPLDEIISPLSGYTAEFASGMMPLTELMWSNQEDSFQKWYIKTGGTDKRYRVLLKLAYLIRHLHSKGLTYCDLSPNNVFVSSEPDKDTVFLIDMDNVRHKTGMVSIIYTPFYGAPEVATNKAPNTPMSDCFSFAVIAYELLTQSHPLIGDYVNDGEPELEEKALSGYLPWVEDSNDSTNARTTGLPSSFFVTSELMSLFRRTFEEGLNNSDARPDMWEWFETLSKSMNGMLTCPECKITYPYENLGACTLCGHTTDRVLHISMRRWDESFAFNPNGITSTDAVHYCVEDKVWDDILLDEHSPKLINTSHFLSSLGDRPKDILEIKMEGESKGYPSLKLTPLNGTTFRLYRRSGEIVPGHECFSSPLKIRIIDGVDPNQKMMITLSSIEGNPQRVLTID